MRHTTDIFNLFDCPRSLFHDKAELEAKYNQLQGMFHPDKFVGQPQNIRNMAAQKSADVNQVYQILQNPIFVLEHVIGAENIAKITPKQAVLLEVMEMREQLADGTITKAAVIEQAKARLSESLNAAEKALHKGEKLADFYSAAKYVSKFLEDVK